MAVTFALSLAAMIYSGPLAPFLSQGIGLTLLGAAIMAVVGPLTLSYRGTLIQPQDVSTILLSLSAGAIAAQPAISAEAAFSTVVALVGVTSIATGLTAYTMGVLKLGYLVRFVPFPVVSGFLAASGVLLVRGAFGMVAPGAGFADLMSVWPLWLPWLAVSLVIVAVSRLSSSGLAIPLLLLLTLAGFFAVTGILGLDFAAMREIGLLLGPFQGGSFLDGINPALLQNVQWSALLAQTPVIASIIGVVTLILGAAGLFGQLQDALNTVWGVEPKPDQGIVATLRARLLSFTMVLGIGFLLLVSLVISAVLSALNNWMAGALPFSPVILQIINLVISLVVITALFSVIYKVLPDVKIAWRDVFLGALVTALLFTIGKFLIGLYLGHSSIATSYGAAGSFVVLLLWIYYSAQILLFGAEFTQVFARRYGSKIVPDDNARFVSAEDLARQGQPHSSLKGQTGRAYQPASLEVAAQQAKVTPSAPHREGNLPTVILGTIAALASFLVGLIISNDRKS